MTKKYTAVDFENARFAEHPDGGTARTFPRTTAGARWSYGGAFVLSDEQMADEGWVPVPTKPTITLSVKEHYLASEDLEFKWGFNTALALLGAEVIPEPEPTNTDMLEELIISAPGNFEGVKAILKRPANVRAWAEYLNNHGVTAPNVKGN